MKYGHMMDFMFDVGRGVGEFLYEEEKASHTHLDLSEIVKDYIDERNLLAAFFLRFEIRNYIRNHMTSNGLEYVDPPFNQDTSFVDDYYDGGLYVFLTDVSTLLSGEIERRIRGFLLMLIGKKT